MIRVAKFDKNKTSKLVDGLQGYRKEYDEKLQRFKDNPLHDWASDIADSFRYLSIAWRKNLTTAIGNRAVNNIKVKRAYG